MMMLAKQIKLIEYEDDRLGAFLITRFQALQEEAQILRVRAKNLVTNHIL